MTSGTNKMTCDFAGKPTTEAYFEAIADFTRSLGQVDCQRKAQVSFSVKRKFLWMWAYEKTADGTLYLNVTLDRRNEDPHIHNVTQVSAHRWNHQVEVKSSHTATSGWLHDLIRQGYALARK
jgi:hypothetical protein